MKKILSDHLSDYNISNAYLIVIHHLTNKKFKNQFKKEKQKQKSNVNYQSSSYLTRMIMAIQINVNKLNVEPKP